MLPLTGPDGITNWYSQPDQPVGAPLGMMALMGSFDDEEEEEGSVPGV